MHVKPVRIYLDSSDYSELSDPSVSTPERRELRRELIRLSKHGLAEFRYSSAHVCEMSPTKAAAAGMAIARTELMVTLCGMRCFRSFPDILQFEKLQATGTEVCQSSIISDHGEWFHTPDNLFSTFEELRASHKEEFQKLTTKYGHNRKMRRLIEKKAVTNNELRPAMRSSLLAEMEENLKEVLRKFPMKHEHARTIGKYVFGEATKEQAYSAFLSSLRDPTWMVRWFQSQFDQLQPFARWLREPAEHLRTSIEEAKIKVQLIRAKRISDGLAEFGIEGVDYASSEERVKPFIEGMLKSAGFREHVVDVSGAVDLERLRRVAPGLITVAEVIAATAQASFTPQPRKPKDSDGVDAIHSLYAPYVDIFRADSFMAPLIRKSVSHRGTSVLGSVLEVIPEIEKRLKGQGVEQPFFL